MQLISDQRRRCFFHSVLQREIAVKSHCNASAVFAQGLRFLPLRLLIPPTFSVLPWATTATLMYVDVGPLWADAHIYVIRRTLSFRVSASRYFLLSGHWARLHKVASYLTVLSLLESSGYNQSLTATWHLLQLYTAAVLRKTTRLRPG